MRYGEDYWTPQQAEDGLAPHDAVWDPASGVWRQVIEDDDEEGWEGPPDLPAPRWQWPGEEGRDREDL